MRNILLFLVQVFDACGLLQMFSSPLMALFCVTRLAKCSTNTPSVVLFLFNLFLAVLTGKKRKKRRRKEKVAMGKCEVDKVVYTCLR